MTDVPCNGCTLCCHYGLIFLDPLRDDVSAYDTEMHVNPATGHSSPALKHKPGGGCIYLGDSGCTIHERAPAVCKDFDCRLYYRSLTREVRRKATGIHRDVLIKGRNLTTWGE